MAGDKWNEVLQILTLTYKPRLSRIDRHDLISFCADNKHIRKVVYKYLSKFKKIKTKSTALSLENYKKGQQYYKENKYECLSLFNASVAYAAKDDPHLADLYNIRSQVLCKLEHLLESLRDIQMALENGYVEDSEVILRKARCLVKLGIVNKVEDLLISYKQKGEIENISSLKKSIFERKLPKLKGGENENYSNASNLINVFYNSEKGRHVIASHDIHPGDVLFIEKPFAFVLLKDLCHNCCDQTLVAPIFCWECKDVSYCSPQCRDDHHKTFHQFECGFNDLFKSIGIAHLSLKIILKASSSLHELKRILSTIKETKNEDGMVSCKSASYEAVFNLAHNMEKYRMLDLFQYAVTALLITLHLKDNTSYMNGASPEDEKFLAGIILRHILQLVCNGHAITDNFVKIYLANSIYTETEERIGTAIYPSVSMMNHSCQPSIMNSFYNDVLVVRAAKEIKKGEEVYNCYGPDARRMRRGFRRKMLQKQYFFTCQCHACLQEHDIQDISTALKCPRCLGAMILDDNLQSQACIGCGEISEISNEMKRKEVLFYCLMEEGEKIPEGNVKLRLPAFVRIWRLGREIYYKFHKDLSYAADEVARCLAAVDDFRRCILFLRCCVLSVERRFGSFSIELAKEMKKLGDAIVMYSLCQQNVPRETIQEGLVLYRKSEGIVSLLYSPDHQEAVEMRMSIRILESKL